MSKDTKPAVAIPEELRYYLPKITMVPQKRKDKFGNDIIVEVPSHVIHSSNFVDHYNWGLDFATYTNNDPVKRSKPSDYRREIISVHGHHRNVNLPTVPHRGSGAPGSSRDRSYTIAYDDLIGQLYSQKTELGMTLATMRESMKTIGDLSWRIYRGLKAVRRGDFSTAAQLIAYPKSYRQFYLMKKRYPRRPRHKRYFLHECGGQYLEYTYGISPLISEIQNLSLLLTQGYIQLGKIAGYGRADDYVEYGNRNPRPDIHNIRKRRTISKTWLHATVHLDDPHVAYRNALGLTNPWVVVNDLIPWSFVINWWTGHEAWLASLDAFAGIHLEDEIISQLITEEEQLDYVDLRSSDKSRHEVLLVNSKRKYFERKIAKFRRPGVFSRVRKWPFSSQRRAVNAAALIGQRFKRI